MKYLLILFLFSSSICLANSNYPGVQFNENDLEYAQAFDNLNDTDISQENSLLVDCTFKVIVNNEDGTSTEYQITVHDVSWWNCKKMQLGAWWDRNF